MLAAALQEVAPAGKWWPYDDPFTVIVSAVLTQQTRWDSVGRSMAALAREGLLTPRALAKADPRRVQHLLRPTGYFRQKARAVRGIARIVVERHGGSLKAPLRWPTDRLRKELLSWPGVGPETADAILLYVARRPVFVVDAYARRLMVRYGAALPTATRSYVAVQRAWQHVVPASTRAHGRLHGAIVDLCKSHCLKRPVCRGCPLSATCALVGWETAVR